MGQHELLVHTTDFSFNHMYAFLSTAGNSVAQQGFRKLIYISRSFDTFTWWTTMFWSANKSDTQKGLWFLGCHRNKIQGSSAHLQMPLTLLSTFLQPFQCSWEVLTSSLQIELLLLADELSLSAADAALHLAAKIYWTVANSVIDRNAISFSIWSSW